jgi:MFS family permease
MIHHHEFWWRFFPHKELTQVYISAALRSFAISLIGLFVPLYLYQEMGFSLPQTLSFYILYSIIFAISTPLAAKFCTRFGVKHSVLFSTPVYIIFIVLLYLLPTVAIPLAILSVPAGISLAFYWMGMNLAFHHASDHKHRGEELGKNRSFNILASMLGPLLGGSLITFIGFKAVFTLASAILFLSTGVLLLGKENHVRYHFSVRSLVDRRHWQNSLFFVSRGTMVMANGVVWPLFAYSILGNYVSLGIVGFLLSGISAALLWIVGRYSDRTDKRTIIRGVTGFESLSWFIRAISSTATHIFGATIFSALTIGIRESPLGALEYDKAQGNVASYFVTREIFICLGRILLLTIVLMTNSLTGGLIFQGIASFAALLF